MFFNKIFKKLIYFENRSFILGFFFCNLSNKINIFLKNNDINIDI